MQNPISFSKTIEVQEEAIDHFNHVNNLVYIKWVLEISKEHWNSFSPKTIRDQFGWMILKHEMHYKRQAQLKDKLVIETWIDDVSTATSVRKTIITDKTKKTLIFESEAQWCFVNLKTRKPSRLTSDILNPYFRTS